MERPESPEDIAQCAREALEADPLVLVAYLFGSYGRGTARADSDLDIAILYGEPLPKVLGGPLDRLRDAVELACRRPCDLIDARTAPVDLVHRVLRDGVLLIERDRSARIAFEVARRNEYFDLLPYLREYRKMASR
jgi:predicted nucleotidyltransferase